MIIALIGFCILISMIIIIDLFFVILVTYKTHTHISKFMLKGDLKYTVCGLRHYGIWKYNSGALNVRLINNKPIFKLYLSPFIGWYLFFNKADDEDWCIIYHEVGHYLLDQMVINTPHSKWHTKKKIWHILNKAFIESYSKYNNFIWPIACEETMYYARYMKIRNKQYTAVHELTANVFAGYMFYKKFGRLPQLELIQTEWHYYPDVYGYPDRCAQYYQMMWGAQYAEKGGKIHFK